MLLLRRSYSFSERVKSFFSYRIDEWFFATSNELSIMHNHYIISTYRVKEMKVMCNNNNCLRHTSPLVDILSKELYRSDIETCIDLIQYDELWREELYLEHLYTPFLTTWEPNIEISLEEFLIESYEWEELLDHTPEYKRCRSFFTWIHPSKVRHIDSLEVFKKSNTGNLWNILEWEKNSFLMTLIRRKRRYILTVKKYLSGSTIARMSHKCECKRRLPWAIVSKNSSHLCSRKIQRNWCHYLSWVYRDGEKLSREHSVRMIRIMRAIAIKNLQL